ATRCGGRVSVWLLSTFAALALRFRSTDQNKPFTPRAPSVQLLDSWRESAQALASTCSGNVWTSMPPCARSCLTTIDHLTVPPNDSDGICTAKVSSYESAVVAAE